jgi:hypothetical protein
VYVQPYTYLHTRTHPSPGAGALRYAARGARGFGACMRGRNLVAHAAPLRGMHGACGRGGGAPRARAAGGGCEGETRSAAARSPRSDPSDGERSVVLTRPHHVRAVHAVALTSHDGSWRP